MNKPIEKRFGGHGVFGAAAASFRAMTADEFAALGAGRIVFRRQMAAGALARIVPQAGVAPSEQLLELVMSADGAPVMVADSREAVDDWIDSHEVRLATLH